MRLWIMMALVIASLVSGELLMKRGMVYMGGFSVGGVLANPLTLVRLVLNPFVIIGMLIYGFSMLLWFEVLSQNELSYVYPILSLSYVLVVIASGLIFGERVSMARLFGTLVIWIGVFIVSRT